MCVCPFSRSLCRRCVIAVTPSCPWTPWSTAVNSNSAPSAWIRSQLLHPQHLGRAKSICHKTLCLQPFLNLEMLYGAFYLGILGVAGAIEGVWVWKLKYAMVLYSSRSLARLLSLQVWSVPRGNIRLLLSWETLDYSHTHTSFTSYTLSNLRQPQNSKSKGQSLKWEL